MKKLFNQILDNPLTLAILDSLGKLITIGIPLSAALVQISKEDVGPGEKGIFLMLIVVCLCIIYNKK